MIDGIALGQAGFERLDAELRAHARTYARLKKAKANERDLKEALARVQSTVEQYKSATEDYRLLYHDEQRKHGNTKTLGVALAVLLTILIIIL